MKLGGNWSHKKKYVMHAPGVKVHWTFQFISIHQIAAGEVDQITLFVSDL